MIEKMVRRITILALFLIPFFSLITVSSFLFPAIDGKVFYFRILVEIAFAGWVALAFLDPKYRPRLMPLTIAITLFAIVTLIADLFGVDPVHSLWSSFERMEGWITIIHLWAFYMVITNVFGSGDEEKKLWHAWLNTSLIIAAIVAIGGLCQMFGWTPFHNIPGRVDAFLGNAEYVAVYMLFNIFIAAYLFIVARAKKKMKGMMFPYWLYLILIILFVSVLLGTQTRGAILGLAGGAILALAFYAVFGKNESRRWRWICGGTVALVLLAGSVLWFNRDAPFVMRNSLLSRFASISLNPSDNTRLYVWPMAVKGGMERPILGWGQENFKYVFQTEYNPAMYSQDQWFDRAHNAFLDWFVNSGFIGLAAYLALYAMFFLGVWRSSLSLSEKSVLIGLLAGYAVNNIFIFDNLASYVMFFFLLGYMASFRPCMPIKCLGTDQTCLGQTRYVLLSAVVCLLLVTIYFFNVRPILVSERLVTAIVSCSSTDPDVALFRSTLNSSMRWEDQDIDENLFSCAVGVSGEPLVTNETKGALINMADNETKMLVSTDSNDAREYFFAGTFLDQVGMFGEAEKLLERAHDLSPARQKIAFELAANYLYQKRNNDAVTILKQAYESAPQYSKAASAYAVALMIDGREDDARKISGVDAALLDRVASYISTGKNYLEPVIAYQGVIVDQSDFVSLIQQSRREYAAGMNDQAVKTLQLIESTFPEYRDLMEGAIRQIQEHPAP